MSVQDAYTYKAESTTFLVINKTACAVSIQNIPLRNRDNLRLLPRTTTRISATLNFQTISLKLEAPEISPQSPASASGEKRSTLVHPP